MKIKLLVDEKSKQSLKKINFKIVNKGKNLRNIATLLFRKLACFIEFLYELVYQKKKVL